MTAGPPTGWSRTGFKAAMAVFVLLAGCSILLLELSHRRIVNGLRQTVSAVDNLTQVRIRVMEAHLAIEGLEAGDPTYDPSRPATELDRALDLLDDWRQGRSSLLEMGTAEPLDDPRLLELTSRYVAAVREVLRELERGDASSPLEWRIAFDELDDRGVELEREIHSALREGIRQEQRRHGIRLAAWAGFLVLVGGALVLLGRMRRKEEAARVDAELAHARAERRYANLAALAAAGILRTDGRGIVREATRWWDDRVGPVSGSEGERWWATLPEVERVRAQRLWRERAPRRRPFSVEVRHVDATGRQRWLLGRWAPVSGARTADGGEWVGTFIDESEKKSVEEQLNQAQKLEAVGRLTGGIAHDFNNLLTVIMGNLDVVRADVDLPPATREIVDDIENAARGGRDLVRGLLDFSRRSSIEPEPLDLAVAIPEIARLAQRLLPAPVHLDLRTGPEEVPVHADPRALQQIVLNLVTNARDAMPEGGRIELGVDQEEVSDPFDPDLAAGRYAVLSVKDDGVGMDPQTIARIFEPFFTTKSEGRGTGLGLASVHGLVRQHRGRVRVESAPGRGTTFQIYLPSMADAGGCAGENVESSEAVRDRQPAAALPAQGAAIAEEREVTILVVEDEESLRRTTSRVLETLGYRVVTAAGGGEALEALDRGVDPDLVISDIAMPEMDGIELHRTLRERGDDRPFLFTTGFGVYDLERRELVPPGSHVLPKPWTVDELSARVEENVRGPSGGRNATPQR